MAVRAVPLVQRGYPHSEFRPCGKFLGHTANLCGGGPMQAIDPLSGMQPMYLNGGGNSVLCAKRLLTQPILE